MQQKEKQMKELAILNGTLKEDQNDHVNWSNRAAQGALFQGALFQSGLEPPPPPPPPTGDHCCGGGLAPMDDEYANFMAELGGQPVQVSKGGVISERPRAHAIDRDAVLAAAPWMRPESEGGIGGFGVRGLPPPVGMMPPPGAMVPPPHRFAPPPVRGT